MVTSRPLPSFSRAGFAGLLATAWLAVTLAALGHFQAWICLAGGAVAAGVVAWRTRAEGRRIGWSDGLALLAALTAFGLGWPPDEMILGGWDPGVYLHTGAELARQGTLRFEIPELAALNEFEQPVISRELWGIKEPFGGMRLLPDGRLSPGFYHLFPSLLAVAWAVGGVRAMLAVNPLLGFCAVLAFHALAARVLDRRAAAAAAWLFALNVAQLWQLGFPTAELLTQVLLLGGLALLSDAARGGRPLDALLGGAAFGLALLCRYDTVMFLVPWLMMLLLAWPDVPHRRALGLALAVLALLVGQVALYQRWIATYYHPVSTLVARAGGLLAIAFAILLALLYLPPLRLRRWVDRGAPWLRGLAVFGLVTFVLWAWWVRPRMGDLPPPLGGLESRNMLHLSALFGPLGLAAAWVGVGLLMARPQAAWHRAWLFAAAAVTGLLVINVFNDQFLMWMARRFIPVAVPLLVLGQAAALAAGAGVADRWRAAVGRWILLAGVLLLVGFQLSALRITVQARDWPGLVAWLDRVAAALPRGAQVFVDQPGFGAPLRFLHGFDAYELHARGADRRVLLAEVLRRRLAQGGEVWLLGLSGPLPAADLRCEPRADFPLESGQQNTGKWDHPRRGETARRAFRALSRDRGPALFARYGSHAAVTSSSRSPSQRATRSRPSARAVAACARSAGWPRSGPSGQAMSVGSSYQRRRPVPGPKPYTSRFWNTTNAPRGSCGHRARTCACTMRVAVPRAMG
jgi:hypothetical protein